MVSAAKKATPRKAAATKAAKAAPTQEPAGGAVAERSPFPPPDPATAVPGPAPKDPAKVAAAEKAKETRREAEASGTTQVCEGPCKTEKPITSFPTTTRRKDGSMGRGKVCRACRDVARATKK